MSLYGPPGENFSPLGAKTLKIDVLAPYRHPRGSKAGPNDPENVTYLDKKNSDVF